MFQGKQMNYHDTLNSFLEITEISEIEKLTEGQIGLRYERFCQETLGINPPLRAPEFREQIRRVLGREDASV